MELADNHTIREVGIDVKSNPVTYMICRYHRTAYVIPSMDRVERSVYFIRHGHFCPDCELWVYDTITDFDPGIADAIVKYGEKYE